jgi:hypothetical protein
VLPGVAAGAGSSVGLGAGTDAVGVAARVGASFRPTHCTWQPRYLRMGCRRSRRRSRCERRPWCRDRQRSQTCRGRCLSRSQRRKLAIGHAPNPLVRCDAQPITGRAITKIPPGHRAPGPKAAVRVGSSLSGFPKSSVSSLPSPARRTLTRSTGKLADGGRGQVAGPVVQRVLTYEAHAKLQQEESAELHKVQQNP